MHHQTAGNVDSLAGNKLGLICGQEQGRMGDILRRTQSAGWDLIRQITRNRFRLHLSLAGIGPLVLLIPQWGQDRAGAKGVYVQALGASAQVDPTDKPWGDDLFL